MTVDAPMTDTNAPAPAGMVGEEEVARALCLADGGRPDDPYGTNPAGKLLPQWIEFRPHARAVIALFAPLAQEVERLRGRESEATRLLVIAKDELVRTADDLSMNSPTVILVEEIARFTERPALNSRAIVAAAIRAGEKE